MKTRNKSQAIRTTLILLFSIALVVAVTWFVPWLPAASSSMLFRLRGAFKPSAEIVIVAIDDQSLQRIGRWPWPRSVMARAIDKLTEARPRSIGLDVIYSEPSRTEDDDRLAKAIARNGQVVLPAQLYETTSSDISASAAKPLVTAWLRPLTQIAGAARSLGHAHVSPEVDGMVRSVQLSKSDDRADRLWAFSLEVVRVADQIPVEKIHEQSDSILLGSHRVPVRDEAVASTIPGVTIVRQNEMLINFAGPAGTFHYHSIADLIDDKIPPSAFADKIVLIGATAQSMGDSRVVPFMHYSVNGARNSQGGQEMPGVEIHANIINTIRGSLSFRSLPDWIAFVAALLVIVCSALAIRWFDGWRQIVMLGLILSSIVVGSFFAFSSYLIVPPLAPMLTGFFAVIPLLLNRSLTASRELDVKLAALVSSQNGFLSSESETVQEAINENLLPHSLAWKLRAVDDLTARLLARMSFINRILSSMGEGVLVADLDGRIVFANREAEQLFGCSENELIGVYFSDYLIERGALEPQKLHESIAIALKSGSSQFEFEIAAAEPRHYSLMLSALVANAEPTASEKSAKAEVIGVVVMISDITKRVELDRLKTETLQLVSHELRTPLTSIHGLSDVLLKFPVAADESREMLSAIHAEAVRLGETINRYLDLTRLESGAQPLNLSSVNCLQLVADCIRNLSVLAADRRISLNARVEPELPPLKVDAQLLTQAIGNLLSNAIKYSPPDSAVIVAAKQLQNNIAISVCDQGYGIPEYAQERIFEKFYRLERDTASGIVGTGLGLPLVKEIIERHGGRIAFQSSATTGTTFTIHLPVQPQTPSDINRRQSA